MVADHLEPPKNELLVKQHRTRRANAVPRHSSVQDLWGAGVVRNILFSANGSATSTPHR